LFYSLKHFFLNNRYKNNNIQYNIITIYHTKYHAMPTGNETTRLLLIVRVRYLILYRNQCLDIDNHGLRYNGWKRQSGRVTGDSPQKVPLLSTIPGIECFQR